MTRPTVYLPALAALALAACSQGSAAPEPEPMLPSRLAFRSDTPYISGSIVSREVGDGAATVRLRVRAAEVAGTPQPHVPEAIVSVHPDSLLLRRDGSAGTAAELTVGRTVMVWVRGPETRSMPPQVTGSAILVQR